MDKKIVTVAHQNLPSDIPHTGSLTVPSPRDINELERNNEDGAEKEQHPMILILKKSMINRIH